MTPPARAFIASGTPWLARLLSLVFFLLIGFALPPQAAAQNTDVIVSIADARVGEGDGSVTLTASLSRTVSQDVMLGITYQDGTATFADDLSGDPPAPRRITIRANNLSANFTVFIRNDTLDEEDETLTVSLGGISLPPGENFVFDGSSHRATLTIIDNDTAVVDARVSIADAQPLSESAAGRMNFRVSMTMAVDSDVVLAVAYAGGETNPATPADDLGTLLTTVTIDEGETSATLAVPLANDAIVEGDETFTVTLSAGTTPLPTGVTITGSTATGTITDADTAAVSLSSTDPLAASEGETITFTVNINNPVAEAFSLGWAASDGTATVDDDLDDQTGTVEIDANAETATFTIPVTRDDAAEDEETFTVALTGAPTGLVNIAPSRVTVNRTSATGTINASNAAPTVNISIAAASATEGTDISFVVTLSTALLEARTLNVGYTAGTGDTGASLGDLGSGRPTTLNLPTGVTTVNLVVPTVDDTDNELAETFMVTLSVPDPPPADRMNTLNITTATATGTILNDDAPTGDVIVSIADARVGEGDGSVTLTARFSRTVSQNVTLGITYQDGTATFSDDLSGDPAPPRTVTIPADSLSADFTVFIRDDTVDELDEETLTVTVGGSSLPPEETFVFDGSHRGILTIIDNDESAVNATVRIGNASVAENDGNAEFTVSLTTAVDSDVTLAVAYADGTATLADDLGTRLDTVTIDQGQTEATLLVPIFNDEIVEGDEDFTVTISENDETPLPEGVTIGTDNEATGTITDNDAGEITLSTDTLTAAENGTFTYTVSLSAPADEAVTVRWTASAGPSDTATVDDDLQEQTGTVEFSANTNTAQTFDIAVNDDNLDEIDETFTVTLEVDTQGGNPLPDGVTIGTTNSVTGTITDNDDPPSVDISIAPASAEEGDNIRFAVTLSTQLLEERTLDVTYTAGTGDTGASLDDLGSDRPSTLTLPTGTTSVNLNVPTVEDSDEEEDETFTVTLALPDPLPDNPRNTLTITTSTATGTITDDDTPDAEVSIANASVVENVASGNAEFTVSLTRAVDSAVTLAVAYTAGTATPATDLGSGRPTTVTIDANTTEATLEVPVTNDNIVEGNEDFTVTLSEGSTSLPEGVTIGTSNSATGTITEDDAAVLGFTGPASFTQNEGTTITPTVSFLSSGSATSATVDVTLTWAAVPDENHSDPGQPADLNPSSGTVTIPAGQSSADITITLVDDTDDEPSPEALLIQLGLPTDSPLPPDIGRFIALVASSNAAYQRTVRVGDNDATSATVSIDDESVVENVSGGDAKFTVSLTQAVDSDVTLAVAYAAGTATLADDLGEDPPDTVTIDQGQTEATLLVPIRDDNIVEGNEDFTVTISEGTTPLPEGVTIGSDNTATGTITDNDMAEVTLSTTTPTAAENGTFTYTVSLSAPADEAVTVRWTATDGTATVDDDLDEQTGTVEFSANTSTAQTFTIAVNDDDLNETNETFTVTLEVDGDNPLPDGVTIGTDNTVTGTITDNDDTPVVTATVSIDDESVVENVSGGDAKFTVSLTQAVDSDVTLAVAYAAGTATLADDLGEDPPDTVTIDRDQTEATLLVPITNDNIVEGNEDFTVTISEGTTPLPEGVTIGSDNTATGTITDNDMAEVTLSTTTPTAAENGTFTYTVSLSAPADEAVVVRWTATDGTATVDDDLDEQTGTVEFSANTDTAQTFDIAVNDDDLEEDNETFTVTLEVDGDNPLPDGVTIGTDNTVTGTITDNDDTPVVTATVSIDDESVVENVSGGTVTFTAALTTAVNSPVVLAVEVTAGTATLGVDLGADLPTSVTIDANTTEATFTVPITDDNIVESDETFTVTLSPDTTTSLPDGVTISDGIATGTITENDTAEITLSPTELTAAEDASFAYTVSLSAPVAEAVTVRWTATAESGDTATVDDDLQETTNTVTFAANTSTAQTFTISPTNDNEDEDNETFTVTLGADDDNPLPTGVEIGTNNSSEATIIDDDDDTPVVTATVSIDDESVVENVSGGTVTFTAALTTAVSSPVVLAVEVTAGTATLGVDLGTDLPTTVTIDANATEATFTVPITDDNIVEGDETFTVTLSPDTTTSLPDGVTISDGIATGTITENDTAEITLTATTATANENGGTFSYTVNLSAAADEAVVVRWTATDGTATVDDDLQETTNTVTFAANTSTAQTFTISPTNDNEDEDNETFTVTLGADDDNPLPTGVEIGTDNSSEATITDDDDTPVVTATVSIDDESVVENVAGGTVTFTAALTAAVSSPVVLAVEVTAGTATLGVDLGTDLPTTVTIDANATEGTFTVPITDDNIVEGNETFTVTLSPDTTTPLPDGVTIRDGTAAGTIEDDDRATVSIDPAELTAAEGRPFNFTVRLSAPADEAVTVTWTAIAGTAAVTGPNSDLAAGQDITATAVFNPGSTTAVAVAIATRDDTRVEGTETFTVTLTGTLPAGVTFGTQTATATITEDDRSSLWLSPEAVRDRATFTFTVNLTNPLVDNLVVNWTATGGAGPGADPSQDEPLSGTATIRAGETSGRFTLDTTGLTPGFTLVVMLSDEGLPPEVTLDETRNTATVTIPPEAAVNATVSIADADPVKEDAGPVRFTVSLSQTVSSDVVLDITYTAGTAGLEDLGSSRPGTVTIPANATTAILAVPIIDDPAIEEAETFTVTLTGNNLPPGVIIADGSAIGTIAFTPEPSILIEPRRTGAGTALRRHVGRFDRMTSTVVRNRLDDRQTWHLSGSQDLGDGTLAVGGGLGNTHWGVWMDGAWAGLGGRSSGRQADIYGGVDYLGYGGDWLIGALIGRELADLDIGQATYRADYTHFGLYGGARLSSRLLVDGALTYGGATPEVAQDRVWASYEAHRLTARGALTGEFELDYGLENGVVTFQPQLGLLYAREQLGAFTDSAGGVADREELELGRLSAGPRLTWAFDGDQLVDGGQLAGGARGQWDFRRLGDGVDGRVSGAVDIGLTLDLAPGVSLGVQGDVDGLGITDEFRSFGGKINLGIRF